MTQDRKDDSKGSKEIEKSRKKADSSVSTSKEKTASLGDGLPTKVMYTECIERHSIPFVCSQETRHTLQ